MIYYMGVDIGTTSTKGLAMTLEGKVLSSMQVPYPTHHPQPGFSEQDPEIIFQAVVSVITSLQQKWGSSHSLEGICFSAAMHSLMAVGQDGQPLTALSTWADSRSLNIAEKIKSSDLGRLIYQRCGTPVHPMLPLCKISWMKHDQPDIFHKTHKFISIKEWIFFRFFEEFILDYSLASATGLFDIRQLKWCPEALELAGIGEEKLSRLVPTTFLLKSIKNNWAKQLGIPKETVFITGASDGCLANLGSQVMEPGKAAFTIGTSGAVRVTTPVPLKDPQERIFNYFLTEKWYVSGGAVNNGGNVLSWYLDHFLSAVGGKPWKDEKLMDLAFSVPPGSGGLIFLPYIQGERAPIWDAGARGAFIGIRLAHSQAHFIRAILEGILYGLFQVTQILEENSGPISTLHVSGGFTKSSGWIQMLADMSGKKCLLTSEEDASVLGAILLGFYATGAKQDLQRDFPAQKDSREFLPKKRNTELYQQLFPVFTGLYPPLKGVFQTLNAIPSEK
ncbi:MAG: gluconokinase [Chitinophagaceae bacterium]